MKLTNLKPLSQTVILKPLTKERVKGGKYLSQIEMILYSTNLCYYSTKIINYEIKVKNKDEALKNITKEIYRIHKIFCDKDDWYNLDTALTKKEHKENFKRFGIAKKRLKY